MGKKIKNPPQRLQIHARKQPTNCTFILSSDDESNAQNNLHHQPHPQHSDYRTLNSGIKNNHIPPTQILNSNLLSSRNYQIQELVNFVKCSSPFKFLNIVGPPGTGKSLLVSYVIQQQKLEPRSYQTNQSKHLPLLQKIQNKIKSLQNTLNQIQIIIIDEFDKLDSHDKIFQSLSKCNAKIILISNSVNYNYHPFIKYLFLTPYTYNDMLEIIQNKIKHVKPFIKLDALTYLVRKVSINSSDVRKINKIIEKAYEINQNIITLNDIKKILKKQSQTPNHPLNSITPFEKAILQIILNFQKHKNQSIKNPTFNQNITLRQIQDEFQVGSIINVLRKFQNLGIIEINLIPSSKILNENYQIKLITKLHHLSNAIKQVDEQ